MQMQTIVFSLSLKDHAETILERVKRFATGKAGKGDARPLE